MLTEETQEKGLSPPLVRPGRDAQQTQEVQRGQGTTTYTFDGSGNLLTSQAPGNQWTTNAWDGENRLTRVALPSGIVNSFIYNGDGQRVQKQDSSGTTKHVWDNQNILLETNASNIIQVVYSLKPMLYGKLVSQCAGAWIRSTCSTGWDRRGSWGTALDLSATVIFTIHRGTLCLALGPRSTSSDTLVNWDITTILTSATTTYAHYYNPGLGRFRSRDPARTSRDISTYWYVKNRPTGATDPSGLFDPFLGWEYGNYCGWNKRGKDPNNPGGPLLPPIDALDAACKRHDNCQATWWTCNPIDLQRCSCALCKDAADAWYRMCLSTSENYEKSLACERAALQVMAAFCPLCGPLAFSMTGKQARKP